MLIGCSKPVSHSMPALPLRVVQPEGLSGAPESPFFQPFNNQIVAPEMNRKSRQRPKRWDPDAEVSRPTKRQKRSASEKNTLASISEEAIEWFQLWQRTHPGHKIPPAQDITALFLLTRVPYEDVQSWFSTTSPKKSITNTVPGPILTVPDNLASVLHRAATALPGQRNHCQKKISVDQKTINRTKQWDPKRRFSCTSSCGRTYAKRCDWDRHEKLNRPQEGWLCNHEPIWENICSFCDKENPDENHREVEHPGRIACCDKGFSLGSGRNARVFLRRSGLKQHFQKAHPHLPFDGFGKKWYFKTPHAFHEKCGFCGHQLANWKNRMEHISGHFKVGLTMDKWKDPWSGPPLEVDEHTEDEDDDGDNDHNSEDGSDSDNGSDGDSNDGQDRSRQPYEGAQDNPQPPFYESFDPPRDRDHNPDPPDSGPWERHGSSSNLILQLRLYFLDILGLSTQRPFQLPTVLGFSEVEQIVRHVAVCASSPLSLARKQPLQSCRTNLILAFWLHRPSKGFTVEALSRARLIRVRILGKGGVGQVEEVAISNRIQTFARKSSRFRSSSQQVDALKELQLLSQIDHPHVVRGIGILVEKTTWSLLMTPVAECTMHDLLRIQPTKPFPSATLMRSFGCLTSALGYMHSRNIRHKDIKPSNILISRGQAMFTDFGCSHDFSNTTPITTELHAHTPLYAAPEVAQRKMQDTSSDIFSLGCVFLEIATVLAGRTMANLHSFVFAAVPDPSYEAYWCNLHKVQHALSLYQSTMDLESCSKNERLGVDQLQMLQRMLLVFPDSRPHASEIMRQFPPSACCQDRASSNFSRRCQLCLEVEHSDYTLPFSNTLEALRQSASLDECDLCSFLLASAAAVLSDDIAFFGTISWERNGWSFQSSYIDKPIFLEFFTLPSESSSYSLTR
jgi:serine/threonine protein kinase